MAKTQAEQLREQTVEIERLRTELENVKKSGEAVYPLPHTMRKGIGDLWRGYVEGRERPDNVPQVEPSVAQAPASGPSNQDIVEFMAAKAIAEVQESASEE